MAADTSVTALVDQLIDLFNRRSLDLPDGLFTRHTQLLLNGVSFEERLSRSPSDPLVLMLARGAAGYRFAAKAMQHAVADAQLQRGELQEITTNGVHAVTGQCRLSGHLRGTQEATNILIDIALRFQGTTLVDVAASVDEQLLAKLQEARLRP